MNRRHFLILTSSTMAAISMPLASSPLHWETLAAVQTHLFPSDVDSPGAKEINATGYLHFVLANDPQESEFIEKGIIYLDKIGKYTAGKPFLDLSHKEREQLLRRFEMGTNGKLWIRKMLQYILEALLTDPIYGGNPKEIGWKWLEHQAGFPRPPINKRYHLL